MEPPHGLVLCCPADVGSVPFLGTALRNSWRAGHEVHLNNINIMISIGAVFLERQPRELPIPRHQRATGGDGSVHRMGNTEQSVCVDLPWQQSCTDAQVVFCRCFCVVLLLSCRPVAGCVGAELRSQSFMSNIVSLRRSCRALGRRPVRLILRAAFGLCSEAAAEKGRMFAVFLTASITRRCRRVQTKHRCFYLPTPKRRRDLQRDL